VTVDSTSQRYTSRVVQDPDILLLHTTEGMSWPGYNGGGTAPHDTIKAIPGKGIIVRRHYPYDQFSKSLENDAGGVETNKRGVIQVELMGTCDPKWRGSSSWYFWPDADDVVLKALADYYRPIMAKYGIPARAMAEFVAYPKSYGDHAAQRLTFTQWMNGSGICGHQHAPENAHGDPGAFPIGKFVRFLAPPAPKPPTLPTPKPTTTTEVPSMFLVQLAGTDPVYKSDGFRRIHVSRAQRDALVSAGVKVTVVKTAEALAAFGPEVTA